MTCREVSEAIAAYLEGVLDERAKREVEAHLARCASCSAAVKDFADLRARLKERGKAFTGASLGASVMAKVDKRALRPRRIDVILRHARGLSAVAAAAILLAATLTITLWPRPGQMAYGFEQTIEANRGVRTMHLIEEVPFGRLRGEIPDDNDAASKAWKDSGCLGSGDDALVLRAEYWAQCDDSGRLLHLRMDWPVTEDGHKLVLWETGKVEVWFKTKNGDLVTREPRIVSTFTESFFDPHVRVADLNAAVGAGSAVIESECALPAEQATAFKVTRPAAPGRSEVYVVSNDTKLLTRVETYEADGSGPVAVMRFLDYNKPIDPSMWRFDLPQDVTRVDETTQVIGLAKGTMTDEQVATEVVKQFFEAAIAKDYAKAGQLYSGIPGEKLQALLGGISFARIVSLGAPYPPEDPRMSGLRVPYEVEYTANGRTGVKKFGAYVRPVGPVQPDRWTITGGI